MASVATAPRSNGVALADMDNETLAKAYAQMIQLRDTVLADKHPRLKLSESAKRKLRASDPNVAHASDLKKSLAQNDRAFTANRAKSSTSGIDPVLLTKSDDLVRAEMQLKRRRIEGALKDAWDHRHTFRDRDLGAEQTSLNILDEVLRQALVLVKPISGIRPARKPKKASSDTSFDENDYYSSRAQTWSSEITAVSYEPPEPTNVEPVVPIPPVSSLPGLAGNVSQSTTSSSDLRRLGQQPLPSMLQGKPVQQTSSRIQTQVPQQAYDVEGEESDYTPPAPGAFTDGDAEGDAMDLDRDDDDDYTPGNELPPVAQHASPQAPVIRNNLTHIAAPQPSRVSPLAVSKAPGLDQGQFNSNNPQYQNFAFSNMYTQALPGMKARKTPETGEDSTAPSQASKKKLSKKQRRAQEAQKQEADSKDRLATKAAIKKERKKQRKEEKVAKQRGDRRKSLRKRDQTPDPTAAPTGPTGTPRAVTPPVVVPRAVSPRVVSPRVFIKQEHKSPPPFAYPGPAHAPAQRVSSQQHNLPPDVEMISAQDFRARQPQYHPAQQPLYSPSRPQEAVSSPHSVVRYGSPAPLPRVRRDDQNLRRVASLQAAQHPVSPEYQPQQSRVYSPVSPYRPVSVHPQEQPPPPQYDPYIQRVPSPAMPPPPPPARKVVVDQFGNKYYAVEAPQPAARASVAPAPPPRQEIIYDRAPSRASTVYAPRHVQPYADQIEHSPVIRRAYQEPEPVYLPREPTLQPQSQYRSQYADEQSMQPPPPPSYRAISRAPTYAPPEYAPAPVSQRAYSVRPEDPYSAPVSASSYAPSPTDAQHYQHRQSSVYVPEPVSAGSSSGHMMRPYSARPEVRYVSMPQQVPMSAYGQEQRQGHGVRQPSMAPSAYAHGQTPGQEQMRAVSVVPAEYAGSGQVRYGYAPPHHGGLEVRYL